MIPTMAANTIILAFRLCSIKKNGKDKSPILTSNTKYQVSTVYNLLTNMHRDKCNVTNLQGRNQKIFFGGATIKICKNGI